MKTLYFKLNLVILPLFSDFLVLYIVTASIVLAPSVGKLQRVINQTLAESFVMIIVRVCAFTRIICLVDTIEFINMNQ